MNAVFRAGLLALSCAVWSAEDARAAQVRGTVDTPVASSPRSAYGYTRAQVASRSVKAGAERADTAVFLAAKESGVIPAPSEPYRVSISGLTLVPKVAACVIDGKVAFTNEDRTPVTLVIEQQDVTTIAPGQSYVYDCRPGTPSRAVKIKEWPHIRGSLFVGEVGIVAPVNANGGFALAAPTGKYELQLIGESGPLVTKPVEVKAADVDVGKLTFATSAAKPVEQPTIAPVEKPGVEKIAPVEPAKKEVAPPAKEKPKDPVKKEPVVAPAKKPPVVPVLPKGPEKKPAEDENLEFESE